MSARVLCGVAAVLGVLALALHASRWVRTGVVAWGPALSMSGLIVLMTTGAFNVPRGPLRLVLSVVGVLGIVGGSVIAFAR
jgi:hypothetical protein